MALEKHEDPHRVIELPLMIVLHYSDDIGFLTMRLVGHTHSCVTFSPTAAAYCGGAIEKDDDGYVVRCADEVWFADKARDLLRMLHLVRSAVDQRNAAVEAVKILLGVISSDPEFAAVDSTKHCVDAARNLMKSYGLWQIDTDHVQEQIR
jgi:hypothetical protein